MCRGIALANTAAFLDAAARSDAIIGCVTQTADQGANIAKLALVRAGWSDQVPGLSVNRYCASGLSAVHMAAQQAMASDGLIELGPQQIQVLPAGRLLVRSVCMVFDAYLGQQNRQRFSRVI